MRPQEALPAASPARRAMLWRAGLLVLLIALAFAALRFTPLADLITRERMVAMFAALRDSWWAPLLLIALYAFTAPLGIPMTPYVVAGAVVFGLVAGSIYNVTGLLLGAATSYYLARALGRDFVVHVTRGRLRRAERVFERSGFWPLVQCRFLPFPFPVINFGAALAGVKAPLFLTTSLLGIIPSTLVHTFFISSLVEASDAAERWWIGAWYLSAFAAFNVLIGYPSLRRRWHRRRRYQELKEARRERRG